MKAILEFDTAIVDRMFSIWGEAVITALNKIPRVTESDGSIWVNAEDIDHMVKEIEKVAQK